MALTRYEHQVQALIDAMWSDILSTPGGYAYIRALPKKGRSSKKALRLKWRRRLIAYTLPTTLLHAMCKAALTCHGEVDDRGLALCTWLLQHVYITPQPMYKVWSEWCAPHNVPTPTQKRKT